MIFSISCFDSEIMLDFGQEYRLFDVSNNSLKDIVRRSLSEYNNSLSYFYFYALRKKIEGVLFEFDRFAEILYITKNGVRTEHYVQLTFDELKPYLGEVNVFTPTKRRYFIETLYSHYKHTHYSNQLDETRKVIEEKYPEYVESYDKVIKHTYAYMFNLQAEKYKN